MVGIIHVILILQPILLSTMVYPAAHSIEWHTHHQGLIEPEQQLPTNIKVPESIQREKPCLALPVDCVKMYKYSYYYHFLI